MLLRSFLRTIPLLPLLAPLGCGADITLVGEPTAEPGAPGQCIPLPPGSPAADPLALTDVRSATFVGETLHVDGSLDGAPTYLVLRVESSTVARLVARRDDLAGPADLAAVRPGFHARLRFDGPDTGAVDVLDTTSPEQPVLVATAPVTGLDPAVSAFSSASDALFFCQRFTPDGALSLVAVDLGDPLAPGAPSSLASSACALSPGTRAVASGAAWVAWNQPTGSWVQQTSVFHLDRSATTTPIDYGYNQSGVHHYGNVVSAATDGQTAVYDPGNDDLFLVARGFDLPHGDFNWIDVDLPAPKSLVGVQGALVYFVTPAGLRAYDVSDLAAPEEADFVANGAPAPGATRLLASSPRYLALVDGAGLLSLVPREGGEWRALGVYAEGAPTPPAGCAE